MPRREYLLRVVCAENGCSENALYRYDYKADYTASRRRYEVEHPWKCTRHSSPERNLRPDNTAVSGTYIATEKFTEIRGEQHSLGLFWVREGAETGNGFSHSDVHTAFAKDFPAGTRLVVTAYVETPEQAAIAAAAESGGVSS
jgi:hypothetical protein